MKILLTGANGYIGKRLLPNLLSEGHQVVCSVRQIARFHSPFKDHENVSIIQADLLDKESLASIPNDIEMAFYLVHSMSSSDDYTDLENTSAKNFCERLSETNCEQVVYLSGIVNESKLSKHLDSRLQVENTLAKGSYSLTTLRAGIIIGSGSASFEIIRDLVEKLPIMITPKWLNTKCQPIAIRDVILLLNAVILDKRFYGQNFDIGGPDVLTYKEMLLIFAKVRGLKRSIFTVPVMTPRLSSYWLYFVTSTSYKLATALVNSMKIEVICRNSILSEKTNIQAISYKEALVKAFDKIDSHEIESSWKDSYASSEFKLNPEKLSVPSHGCLFDNRVAKVENKLATIEKVWSIGGENGWYYGNLLWKIRGYLDKLVGGVGLRRGRTNQSSIKPGDSLDFWRVLIADKNTGRLVLYAEMKLPGEAWLEFKIKGNDLHQTATFRPKGLMGRLYWYSVIPFHNIIFKRLVKILAQG